MAREAWRKHKRIKKDKAKRQQLWGRIWGDGPQPWFKRYQNKKIRTTQKRMLYNGYESYSWQDFKRHSKEYWT